MSSNRVKFTNELDNKIIVSVKQVKHTGNNKDKKKCKFTALSLAIIGPTSMAENFITVQEGYELYKLLHEYFKTHDKLSVVKEI